jgi:hypothetical protein
MLREKICDEPRKKMLEVLTSYESRNYDRGRLQPYSKDPRSTYSSIVISYQSFM